MYIRAKEVKGATYYQVVQGYRDDAGRVRHRTLASLGQYPTLADALKATERDLRRARREADRERAFWPDYRPPRSERRLAALERRVTRLEEQRHRLNDLIQGRVDTTPRTTPPPPPPRAVPVVERDHVVEAVVVGRVRGRATLIGMGHGKVDVLTSVGGTHRRIRGLDGRTKFVTIEPGEQQTTWLVRQEEVEATLRTHGFPVDCAEWSEPRPVHPER